MKNREYAVEAVVQEFYGQSMTEDEGFIAPDFFAMAREILNLRAERGELQLQVGDWQDVAEQTIAAARGTMIDAAGERQLRELVASLIAYQKENAQLFEVNAQLIDVIEDFVAAQGTSKEDEAYTALCAYPRHIIRSWKGIGERDA